MTRFASLAAAIVALALVPAVASGQAPPPPPPHMPECAAGQFPTHQQPCMLPPCPQGERPTPERPCHMPGGMPPCAPGGPCGPGPGPLPHCEPGTHPTHEKPCAMPPGHHGPPPGHPGHPGPGPGGDAGFMPGFLSKVWRFSAEAENYDAKANVLNVTVTKVHNLPKAMADQDDEIVDEDADVLFSATTKVFANGKQVPKESRYDALLDAADTVSVSGKILPAAKWRKDEDGTPVTTIRAKRVTITG